MAKGVVAIELLALSLVFAAGTPSRHAAAASAFPAAGIPCSGVWKLNEAETHRARSPINPIYQFFEPWGENGWMRLNTSDLASPTNGAEWHFEQFDDRPYQVFGGDPSLQHSRRVGAQIIGTTRVRLHRDADLSFVVFAKDCSRVTYYFPEGEDRHGAPGKTHYYNDVRVFDKIEPPDRNAAPVASDIFGGWMLDRQASKPTLSPNDDETVITIPWGTSGWIWSRISGGPYQPSDLVKGIPRAECGAAQGPAAIACKGPSSRMTLYWASWDQKTFPTYGSAPGQVQIKRLSDRSFEITFLKPVRETQSVVLSRDAQHLTVTTKINSGDLPGDVRVYDRIDAAKWPTVAP
jgi:hypothetical protein